MKLFKSFLTVLNISAIIAFTYSCGRLSWGMLAVVLAFYVAVLFVNLIVHECGHLIGGKISGYKLLLIQFGPLRIAAKSDRGYTLSLRTACSGQCIMIPKDISSVRYTAYNIGGIAANLAVSALSLVIMFFSPFCVSLLFFELFCTGIQKALINVIPYKSASVMTDGYTVRLLRKDKRVVKDYANYLILYGKLFLNEQVSPDDFMYEREKTTEEEMLYYYEIQSILSQLQSENDNPSV